MKRAGMTRWKRMGLLLLALGFAWTTAAQDLKGGGYTKMKIEKVGSCKGSFGGAFRIQSMTGGVSIVLKSDDPAQKDLPIRAQSMNFDWPEGADRPNRLVLEGNVQIQHPEASVSAEKAEWNFETGKLVFTGSPKMDSERAKNLRASRITLNFKTNQLETEDMSIEEVPMESTGGLGGSADPNLLTEADIKDWAGFVDAIKADLKKAEACPGKQLAAKLGPEAQAALKSMGTDLLVQNKSGLLKNINKVLGQSGLYNKEAWAGVPLDDETKALLDKKERTPAEQTRQNRLLIQAAFPAFVKARS